MPFIVSCGGVVCSTAVLCIVKQPSFPSGVLGEGTKNGNEADQRSRLF